MSFHYTQSTGILNISGEIVRSILLRQQVSSDARGEFKIDGRKFIHRRFRSRIYAEVFAS